jgi:hypothetical protein
MAAILNYGHNIFSPRVKKCHPPDSVHRHAGVTKITKKRCIDPKTTFGGKKTFCNWTTSEETWFG